MKMKGMLFALLLFLLPGIAFVLFAFRKVPDTEMNITNVNDIVSTFSEHWDLIYEGDYMPEFPYNLDYAVIDHEGRLVAVTRSGLNETIVDAVRDRDTILDIKANDRLAGKIIFHNDANHIMEKHQKELFTFSVLLLILLLSICLGFVFYLYYTVLRPFNKLQSFSRRIAEGNLDIPLEMDKNNLFGAFTESFDLMREELKKSRENERRADQSKKELVASLSHDIKTPVASIKAVTELMLVTTKEEKDRKQLETISAKAEQINLLITDMFRATLEELETLRVTVLELPSTAIPDLIKNADYKGLVQDFDMPDGIVLADPLRLQQIFDNIIHNSYKYAGTDIKVKAAILEDFMVIEIMDFGAGVLKDELPLLLHKFYRGKNAGKKGGYGLGLYISHYLITQMSGKLTCDNYENGFSVKLVLRLA